MNATTQHIKRNVTEPRTLAAQLESVGEQAKLFSVVTVLGWIGAMKFTAYEAGAIEGLVASSPLTS